MVFPTIPIPLKLLLRGLGFFAEGDVPLSTSTTRRSTSRRTWGISPSLSPRVSIARWASTLSLGEDVVRLCCEVGDERVGETDGMEWAVVVIAIMGKYPLWFVLQFIPSAQPSGKDLYMDMGSYEVNNR